MDWQGQVQQGRGQGGRGAGGAGERVTLLVSHDDVTDTTMCGDSHESLIKIPGIMWWVVGTLQVCGEGGQGAENF